RRAGRRDLRTTRRRPRHRARSGAGAPRAAEPDMTDDEKTIRDLHARFCEANTTGDVAFLRAHMAPGPDALRWFNLNHSNSLGVDHICELWDFLRGVSGARAAR